MRVTSAVLPLLGFAREAGVAPGELLRAARIDDLPEGADIDLAHAQELRLWSEAARLTGDDDFGLHLGEWIAPRTEDLFDVLAFALRSCPTLGDHYRRGARYIHLVHPGIYLRIEEEGERARLVHGHHHEPAVPPRHPVEGMLTLALQLGRDAIGEDFAPRAVHFRHPRPTRVSEHERIFRAPLHFGSDRDELVLDRALLDRPQRRAEPRLFSMLSRHLEQLLTERSDRPSFLDAVRRAMKDELVAREPSITNVAARQRMSPRSLQRRLQEEGTTFAALLGELRHDLARRYLRDPRIAIGEVGFLLGFQDVTAFHRAFKRWTGTTPARYRRDAPKDPSTGSI